MQLMEEWEGKAAERDAALSGVAGGMADADAAAGGSAGELQYVAYVPLQVLRQASVAHQNFAHENVQVACSGRVPCR